MIDYINEQNHKLAVRAKLDRTPLPNPAPGDYPWVGVFTGGTRLSTGLARAIQALREAGTRGGQIVLVSDLRDAPEDLPRVGVLITRMRELGIELRVVTVGQQHAQPQGVLRPRRLGVHHGRGRFRLRAGAGATSATPGPRAPARPPRHRARGAARPRRAVPAPAVAQPRGGQPMTTAPARCGSLLGVLLLALRGRIRLPRPRHRGRGTGLPRSSRRSGSAGSCPRPPLAGAGAAGRRGDARDPRPQRRAAGLSGLPGRARQT